MPLIVLVEVVRVYEVEGIVSAGQGVGSQRGSVRVESSVEGNGEVGGVVEGGVVRLDCLKVVMMGGEIGARSGLRQRQVVRAGMRQRVVIVRRAMGTAARGLRATVVQVQVPVHGGQRYASGLRAMVSYLAGVGPGRASDKRASRWERVVVECRATTVEGE